MKGLILKNDLFYTIRHDYKEIHNVFSEETETIC